MKLWWTFWYFCSPNGSKFVCNQRWSRTEHITWYTETAEPARLQQFKIVQMVFLLLWICFTLTYLCIATQTTSIKSGTEHRGKMYVACRLWKMTKGARQAGFWYLRRWNHLYRVFHLSQLHPRIQNIVKFAVLCHLTFASAWDPERVPFELSYYKNMSALLQTVGSALARPHRKLKQWNKPSSVSIFKYSEGSCVMQFPSTCCPLTGAPSVHAWAAATLQHQHYDGGEGRGCSSMSQPQS